MIHFDSINCDGGGDDNKCQRKLIFGCLIVQVKTWLSSIHLQQILTKSNYYFLCASHGHTIPHAWAFVGELTRTCHCGIRSRTPFEMNKYLQFNIQHAHRSRHWARYGINRLTALPVPTASRGSADRGRYLYSTEREKKTRRIEFNIQVEHVVTFLTLRVFVFPSNYSNAAALGKQRRRERARVHTCSKRINENFFVYTSDHVMVLFTHVHFSLSLSSVLNGVTDA